MRAFTFTGRPSIYWDLNIEYWVSRDIIHLNSDNGVIELARSDLGRGSGDIDGDGDVGGCRDRDYRWYGGGGDGS